MLSVIVVVAALVDLWWRSALAGTAFFLAVTVSAAALVRLRFVQSRTGITLVSAAIIPAVLVALRASPWLVPLDVACAVGLLALGVTFGRADDFFDQSFTSLARRTFGLVAAVGTAPVGVAATATSARPPARAHNGPVRAVARGLLLAVPVVVAVGWMLASADAVFASWFSWSVDVGDLATEVLVFGGALWLAAAMFVHAGSPPTTEPSIAPRRLGAIEACVVLGGLIAVYAVFAVARLVVATRGADYVLATTGLTYAEYARSGFFQLLWAAALTLVVLLGLRATVPQVPGPWRTAFRVLSVVAVALTLVLVQAALLRLDLYTEAFGLTMLRLSSTIFAYWVGATFVLTGLSLAGIGSRRNWLAGAVISSAVLTLVLVNMANPEARVVRHNVAHQTLSGEADVAYLVELSDDAVPALVDSLASLSPADRSFVTWTLCGTARRRDMSWNLASVRAAAALVDLCDQRT